MIEDPVDIQALVWCNLPHAKLVVDIWAIVVDGTYVDTVSTGLGVYGPTPSWRRAMPLSADQITSHFKKLCEEIFNERRYERLQDFYASDLISYSLNGHPDLPPIEGLEGLEKTALSISPEIREGVGERGDVLSGAGLMALS